MSSNIRINRICQFCGKEFEARKTTSKTCSDHCAKRLYKKRQQAAKIENSNHETQLIKQKPILDLKAKEFLSVAETCTLLGISRRTIYRLIERGQLKIGKAGKRTLVKRTEIDQLFDLLTPVIKESNASIAFVESECYNVADIRKKYGISQTALRNLINKHNIPTFYEGRFAYVPKKEIDQFFVSHPKA